MIELGKTIKDPAGVPWIVTQVWKYIAKKTNIEYLCVSLIGAKGPKAGQMGGARFKTGEAIMVKR